ncbi:MAG TPA: 3-hydroxyacyl-CoA dehydrogenase family protein [Candidatus Polarisedimenticolia bacterium]|nr:3-hydroxyacyl-CoA dehydrogenase family protein [Candidatus Polarisedimenticolia bacterium]
MSTLIRTVTVLGAGTMGAGIAQVAALAGMKTVLHDPDAAALSRGLDRAVSRMEEGVRRGKLAPADRDAARSRLAAAQDAAEAGAQADLIVEAAPESMELKKRIFAELGRVCRPEAILASNTSSLSVTEIASGVPDPSRVVGLHFFNPPHIMKLVEIVRGDRTSDRTIAAAEAFARAAGKEPIVVLDSPGFATSRLGLALGLEAMRMVEQGVATPADIDKAMELGYGHPMGPLKVSDLVGLDVRLSIAEILHRELGGEQFRPPAILRRLVRAGKLGRKTGEGFHRWDEPGGTGA